MDRTLNGTWGQVHIKIPDPTEVDYLLVFETNVNSPDDQLNFTVTDTFDSYAASLPYDDDGWKPKSLLLANRNEANDLTISYSFNGSFKLSAISSALFFAMAG